MERRRQGYYKAVTQQVANRFNEERKAVVSAYQTDGMTGVGTAIDSQKQDWFKLFTAVNLMVIEDFGNAMFEELKGQAEVLEIKWFKELFSVFANAVQNWISWNVANKVVGITTTTAKMIQKIVEKGQMEGMSINQIAKEIDGLYLKQIIPNRSKVIARTEVISSSNAGNRFAALQTGLPLEKEWISTLDDRVRDENDKFNHKIMHGVRIPMDEYYQVPMSNGGTESLMFPTDPSGSAGNVIQCRCTEGYHVIKR